jgi:hypothetical protein
VTQPRENPGVGSDLGRDGGLELEELVSRPGHFATGGLKRPHTPITPAPGSDHPMCALVAMMDKRLLLLGQRSGGGYTDTFPLLDLHCGEAICPAGRRANKKLAYRGSTAVATRHTYRFRRSTTASETRTSSIESNTKREAR